MMVLYGARYARRDLLRAVCYFAKSMSKWKKAHDDQLHRLFCIIDSTLDMHQIGYVGDKIEDIELTLFADADFAGDKINSHSKHQTYMWP